MNEDCVHMIYFDPQKYPVCNKFKGDGYSLLCTIQIFYCTQLQIFPTIFFLKYPTL